MLLALLALDVRRMNDRLLEAFYLPAERRIRRRVLEIAAMYGDEPPITVPLTQEELAALAGTARATVNRVLRESRCVARWSFGAVAPWCSTPPASRAARADRAAVRPRVRPGARTARA